MRFSFYFSFCLFLSPILLYASNNNIEFAHRLERLEEELKTLNHYVYKERKNFQKEAQKNKKLIEDGNFGSELTGNQIIDFDIRINRLEKQLSFLYGKIETLDFAINSLNSSFNILAKDIDGRLEDLESAINAVKGAKIEVKTAPKAMPGDSNAKILGVVTQEKGVTQEEVQPLDLDREQIAQNLYNRAFAALRKKDYSSAERDFRKFLASYAEHRLAGPVSYWLGEVLYVTGRTEEAMIYYGDAYRNYPQNSKKEESLYKLALSLAKLGRKREACLAFDQLVNHLKTTPVSIREEGVKEMKKLDCTIPKN